MILVLLILALFILTSSRFGIRRNRRSDHFRNKYHESEEWLRKRYEVFRRDHWRCLHCGERATQVQCKRDTTNIEKEPIKQLVSVCDTCREAKHQQ